MTEPTTFMRAEVADIPAAAERFLEGARAEITAAASPVPSAPANAIGPTRAGGTGPRMSASPAATLPSSARSSARCAMRAQSTANDGSHPWRPISTAADQHRPATATAAPSNPSP